MKAAEWNPELSSKYRTNRAFGRPMKRWEDDINEFLKLVEDETEKLYWKQQPNPQNMDQHSKETADDGLYSKKKHNDFRRTTGKIMRERE